VREQLPGAAMPMEKNMTATTDILFRLGEPDPSGDWPDYLAHGFTDDDVPALVALVRDPELHNMPGDSDEVWVPVHAWRTLGQLRAAAAAPALAGCFDDLCDDDWALEELPRVMGLIGEPAIPAAVAILRDPARKQFARIMAVDALAEVAQHHPALRGRVLEVYRDYLRQPAEDCPMLNGLLMGRIIDLRAVELIDEVRALFARDCVDIQCAGDLEDVEIELGLRETRDTPRPDYGRLGGLEAPPERPDGSDPMALIQYVLNRHGGDGGIMNLSELDGYMAAVLCAPAVVMPSRWLPEIWGGDEHAPVWDGEAEATDCLSALMFFHDRVSSVLAAGLFEPILLEARDSGETVTADWCAGFERGLRLWPPLSGRDRELLEEYAAPIRRLARGREDGGDRDGGEDVAEVIADAVARLHERFGTRIGPGQATVRRTTPKVGRNDPCPCGSGKKYKRCCLH